MYSPCNSDTIRDGCFAKYFRHSVKLRKHSLIFCRVLLLATRSRCTIHRQQLFCRKLFIGYMVKSLRVSPDTQQIKVVVTTLSDSDRAFAEWLLD
jgi:hypothetical protein